LDDATLFLEEIAKKHDVTANIVLSRLSWKWRRTDLLAGALGFRSPRH
jgi:hypothetical protein